LAIFFYWFTFAKLFIIMLKKFSQIFMILTLILATAGISVSKHYCGGKLQSASLFHSKNCCDNSCKSCHNEVSTYRLTDNFFSSDFQIEKAKHTDLLNSNLALLCFTLVAPAIHVDIQQYTSPPLINPNKTASLQVFRC
jgi:hypothetical protein